MVKRILSILGGTLIVLVLLFGLFLFYINFTDYMPAPMEELQITHRNPKNIESETLSLMTWNIGYAGLGREMDFFYEGGKMVRPAKELTEKYLNQITNYMQSENNIDFWLLQEVDFKAKRTWRMDQAQLIGLSVPDYNVVTAVNYNVPFVPIPLSEPMGKVKAGLMTLSKFSPRLSRRYAYPQIAGWPDRMFLLDRCFIETRFSLDQGRELVVLNTHNSAFIADQLLMDKELQVIHDKMMREYELGNYVIAGGDWNMNPPFLRPENNYNGHLFKEAAVKFPADFLPAEWKFAFDSSVPSNRYVDKAYVKGSNGTTTIDFFIVSPNVGVESVRTIDLEFENSDHNPVQMNIYLR
ncbi:MAG: hypothetical protein CVT92_02015 [Bacteroidetes bacterium HGW-Bacteroidetes-1]|jgi:endonuclease/exonuclease/phosphatase family metal-dependent hydrolase|nr:MAG: hypothetical protein CVT92_02015 [Bacteroidetes bacterium HGW-Bacteroidetes-1]